MASPSHHVHHHTTKNCVIWSVQPYLGAEYVHVLLWISSAIVLAHSQSLPACRKFYLHDPVHEGVASGCSGSRACLVGGGLYPEFISSCVALSFSITVKFFPLLGILLKLPSQPLVLRFISRCISAAIVFWSTAALVDTILLENCLAPRWAPMFRFQPKFVWQPSFRNNHRIPEVLFALENFSSVTVLSLKGTS